MFGVFIHCKNIWCWESWSTLPQIRTRLIEGVMPPSGPSWLFELVVSDMEGFIVSKIHKDNHWLKIMKHQKKAFFSDASCRCASYKTCIQKWSDHSFYELKWWQSVIHCSDLVTTLRVSELTFHWCFKMYVVWSKMFRNGILKLDRKCKMKMMLLKHFFYILQMCYTCLMR